MFNTKARYNAKCFLMSYIYWFTYIWRAVFETNQILYLFIDRRICENNLKEFIPEILKHVEDKWWKLTEDINIVHEILKNRIKIKYLVKNPGLKIWT